MTAALAFGLRGVRKSYGLVFVVLLVNLSTAALLAIPLADALERDLRKTEAARHALYGFDPAWWGRWHDTQSGFSRAFSPDILGKGFAFRNVELLLRGELPLGLLRAREETEAQDAGSGAGPERPDGVILGLGAAYLLIQTFLLGGVLSVFRGELGAWSARSLLHGSGFYFGRLLRVALIALAVDYVLLRLNGPFAAWADARARESVSETTALVWTLSRHALLLLALLLVNMLSSLAKTIVVLEERESALLAWLSAVGFAAAFFGKTAGHYLALAALGVAWLALYLTVDGWLNVTGYKTQLVALLLAELLIAGRIALRLSLFAGQIGLYRKQTAP